MSDSIYKSEGELKLLERLEDALSPTPFRIVDMDLRVGPRSLLRIFIEKKLADDANARKVSIDDCATVSRALDPVLEVDTTIPQSYDLEVSSAGLDRRLRLKADFEEVIGNEVKLALVEKLQGVAANVRAKLLRLEGNDLIVNFNGNEVPVRLAQISKANLVWDENKSRAS